LSFQSSKKKSQIFHHLRHHFLKPSAQICESGGQMQFLQSPLFVALQDGFERLLEGVKSDERQFIVNAECLKSAVLEAIFMSRQ
jgi:hypothetical protein